MADGDKRLNLEVGKKVSEFESMMHRFEIKTILYQLLFRGKGLEFDGYREYSPSEDDASRIDWKSSMRANKKLVKKYIEERDLQIMFVVDVSEKMVFGSTDKLKCEYVAEMVAAISHLILNSNDKVGIVLYNEKVVKLIMPKSGKKRFSLVVNELSKASYYKGGSNINYVLNYLLDYLNEDISALFLFSDFVKLKRNSIDALSALSNRYETIAIMVKDPLDKKMPEFKEEVVLEDSITGQQVIVNPRIIKGAYEKNALQQEREVEGIFRDSAIDFLKLSSEESFVPGLVTFLKERIKRKRNLT